MQNVEKDNRMRWRCSKELQENFAEDGIKWSKVNKLAKDETGGDQWSDENRKIKIFKMSL